MNGKLSAAIASIACVLSLTACAGLPWESTPTPTATTSPSASSVPGTAVDNPLAIGSAISGDGWSVEVLEVVTDATQQVAAANQYNPAPPTGSQYVLVKLDIKRTGTTAAHPFAVEIGVITAAGVTVREAPAEAPNRIDLLAELQPGSHIEGYLAFLVPSSEVTGSVVSVIPGDVEDRGYVGF